MEYTWYIHGYTILMDIQPSPGPGRRHGDRDGDSSVTRTVTEYTPSRIYMVYPWIYHRDRHGDASVDQVYPWYYY